MKKVDRAAVMRAVAANDFKRGMGAMYELRNEIEMFDTLTDAEKRYLLSTKLGVDGDFSNDCISPRVHELAAAMRIAGLAEERKREPSPGTQTRYYVGKIHENNGGKEYMFTVVFATSVVTATLPDGTTIEKYPDPEDVMDGKASSWYDDGEDDGETLKVDGTYMFDFGSIEVRAESCEEITKAEFDVLEKYL